MENDTLFIKIPQQVKLNFQIKVLKERKDMTSVLIELIKKYTEEK